MKKLIQIGAVLSLVFVFSIISASAQTIVKQYDAKIPFDFNISGKSYQAGNYVIKISRLSSNGLAVSLEDGKRNNLQTFMVAENGETAKGEPQLQFSSQDNKRFLTGILTRELGISIGTPKANKNHNVKNQQPAAKTQIATARAKKN